MSYNSALLTPKPKYGIIGHRGVANLRPENTMAGFRHAVELGLNWVELDARLTKDDKWVLFHDDDFSRISNTNNTIEASMLSELSNLDVGTWFDEKYSEEKLVLLTEFIDFAYKSEISINIEVKTDFKRSHHYAEQLTKLLDNKIPDNMPQPLISSFDINFLKELRRLNPQIRIGYLVQKITADTWKVFRDNNFTTLNVSRKFITQQNVAEAKLNNIPIIVYTVNETEEAYKLFSWGVTAVFTDSPKNIKLAYNKLKEQNS